MNNKQIVDRLEEVIGFDGSPQRLRLAIEAELNGFFQLGALAAAEKAERVESRIADIISERQRQAEAHGLTTTLTLVGSRYDFVAGSCCALPYDHQEVTLVKQQRTHVATLLGAMRALDFSQFERFCARVLVLLGTENAKITPHGGDQGIDFYGRLSLGQYQSLPAPFMKLAHDVKILFVGQAKHYPDRNLGPSIVRELIGAVGLARSGVFSKENLTLFDEPDLKPFSPAVTFLFTTGGVSSGARQLAASAGIIIRSGEQLAVFLADHGVGMKGNGGVPQFDPEAFKDWVKTSSST